MMTMMIMMQVDLMKMLLFDPDEFLNSFRQAHKSNSNLPHDSKKCALSEHSNEKVVCADLCFRICWCPLC